MFRSRNADGTGFSSRVSTQLRNPIGSNAGREGAVVAGFYLPTICLLAELMVRKTLANI
jgi:hypothetical protein